MRGGLKKRSIILGAMGAALAVVGLIIGVYSYHWSALHDWIDEDRGVLAPYATMLVADGDDRFDPDNPMDTVLADAVSKNRLVVEISRSEYHYDLIGKTAWVKVYMVTRKPGEEKVQVPIKLLVEMVRTNGGWTLKEQRELALP